MALINTQPIRIDDLDKTHDAKPHTITIDGVTTEIDLNDVNHKALLAAVGPYLDAGRRIGKAKGAKRTVTAEDKTRDAAIRAWRASVGRPLKSSGRIPQDARSEWEAAGSPAVAA